MHEFKDLMKLICYNFDNINFLKISITHSSFDQKSKKNNFERLEFLGDRVLGLIISEYIFKKFKNESEGHLAKRFSYLVCKKTLISIALDIKLQDFILVSNDLSKSSLNSILANSLEAMIGAVFLDSSYPKVKKVVLNLWKHYLSKHIDPPIDPKSKLQEWCLKNKKTLPSYELISKIGPDHEPIFTIKVGISKKIHSSAKGKNKQDAEVKAANKLLKKIND